ncbi:hypothetical protein [Streptomyces sp. 7-21]|jgi:hypothetical protein|uniref:hypothetical protein n=1 Tax=Streptomyces sp. 7-21 TaxID=2802283 RepID=UPI00191CD911|nr:hypothetical protein [Streptomyces sp. 7-21]MBL1068162.1 hypothetical protein [Streptomyces sp. 7-21]
MREASRPGEPVFPSAALSGAAGPSVDEAVRGPREKGVVTTGGRTISAGDLRLLGVLASG